MVDTGSSPALAALSAQGRPRTVGERMDAAARRVAGRNRWTSVVAGPLGPALRRGEELTGMFAGRFERIEAGGADGDLPAPASPSPSSAPGAPRPARPAPHPGPPDRRTPADLTAHQAAGHPLPVDVRARLRDLAGPGADVMRVHDDAAADLVARARSAEAVAAGPDVFVRDGHLRPDDPAGFGLLAHEATHVSSALAGDGHGPALARSHDDAAEEGLAMAHEQQARRQLSRSLPPVASTSAWGPASGATAPDGPAVAVGPVVAWGPPQPSGTPHAARSEGPPDGAGATAPSPGHLATVAVRTAGMDRLAEPPQPPLDLVALRRDLVDDLLRRLRSDGERGA